MSDQIPLDDAERLQQKMSALFGAASGNPLAQDADAAEGISIRQANARKTASGPSLSLSAAGRPNDPTFYWGDEGLPYGVEKPEELAKIRRFCRNIYMTHPLIPSAIDVFSIWPMTGMEFICKDQKVADWFSQLFLDQLNYEEYLVEVGREYWKVGEAFPFGSFNDNMGVWEDDELIDPDDVQITKSPFFMDPRFEMRIPREIRALLASREPKHEYDALVRAYPRLVKHAGAGSGEELFMGVSGVLLKHLAFKPHPFHHRGLPILMRAFRPIMQEERLNSAMDAIADRLYTPMILAKIGASASDLGTDTPWIPKPEDLANFETAVDAALAGDFRMLTYHFAVQMDLVFGREAIPNFDADFERLDGKMLQPFGLSKTMLSGGSAGETYAADAINRDLVSQLLSTYQNKIKRFIKDRMAVVAEAQQFYDYEVRGDKRYPIMEEVQEVDEESGEMILVERPKLLIPDIELRAMNMRDDTVHRQFVEALSAGGVPISIKTRLQNIPYSFDEEVARAKDEQVDMAVAAQEARKAIYEALRNQGLPIPEDLAADFAPTPLGGDEGGETEEVRPVSIGGDEPLTDGVPLVPSAEENAAQGEATPPMATVQRLPTNKMQQPTRPPESDEMREGMPRAASLDIAGPAHVGLRLALDPTEPLEANL